jgi:hypothetical protein
MQITDDKLKQLKEVDGLLMKNYLVNDLVIRASGRWQAWTIALELKIKNPIVRRQFEST